MVDDKLYLVLLFAVIGLCIYWYQKRIENTACKKCIKRKIKKEKKKHNKKPILKSVRFKDDNTDVSLESLDSSDHLGNVSNNNDNDSKSCDTLDI